MAILRQAIAGMTLLALTLAAPAWGAPTYTGGAAPPLRHYVRQTWQTAEGLPQNSVRAIAQTPDGYLWLPTMDHSAPSADAIHVGAAFVSAAVDAGKRVLIHCHAGKGRSALLCAATLVLRGMSVDDAWALVKRQRPIAGLHRAQRMALEAFAAKVQQEREA